MSALAAWTWILIFFCGFVLGRYVKFAAARTINLRDALWYLLSGELWSLEDDVADPDEHLEPDEPLGSERALYHPPWLGASEVRLADDQRLSSIWDETLRTTWEDEMRPLPFNLRDQETRRKRDRQAPTLWRDITTNGAGYERLIEESDADTESERLPTRGSVTPPANRRAPRANRRNAG